MLPSRGETIFALSSGQPPAGIAVIRISGSAASHALLVLARRLPKPRIASLALLTDPADGSPLDRALLLWLPGPSTVTGDDIAEIHCHGGRAVVAAIETALEAIPGLRRAEAGEFTRRAFENGRMDLTAVEGLSDLLAAQTQTQRRAALMMVEGHFSQRIEDWRERLLNLSAMAEAALDFSDEDDVPDATIELRIGEGIRTLGVEISCLLSVPNAERLHDGVKVVLAGPPNVGKSTLLNALVGRDAAIVSDIAGTTRDRIDVPVAIAGTAFLFTDTAGLRAQTHDAIEAIGMDRAHIAMQAADIILWLGDAADMPRADAVLIAPQSDRQKGVLRPGLSLSAHTGEGMDRLIALLLEQASLLLPGEGEFALHQRQKDRMAEAQYHLHMAGDARDLLIVAEELRLARRAVDALTGQAGTEDMLDRLFSGFCIGK
ncbi:tRNA uridine-5-carboxymethylaminomethyl(34) synthesis GTPase MnmE [Sphingobium sp.]|uniref:tRNA uridine-5-carboxymethylaminomethyl(34) synthesis GTPase MnmE n=1 Tax=Sphingobium sp. TaxID=1912891 RepID=UPI003BB4C35D